MPIYEFECENCGKSFEELIYTKKDKQNICCPKCGGKKVNILMSMFGVAGTEKKVSTNSCSSCSTKTCSTCG
jgi:putative FmdB family regulatory protein